MASECRNKPAYIVIPLTEYDLLKMRDANCISGIHETVDRDSPKFKLQIERWCILLLAVYRRCILEGFILSEGFFNFQTVM